MPFFELPLHVGRPNIGDRAKLMARLNAMLDRRWLSNDGPLVQEFEARVAEYLGVKHVLAMCNATVALEIAYKAVGFSGEVILPSYTFIATAHALQWQGISPRFVDIDPNSHNIDPKQIERHITPATTGIVGVHVWGRGCPVDEISAIAKKHNLKVVYDSSHAFGCSRDRLMLGNFGECEVFSFHATKFINCFEGGVVVTNDDELAEKIRLMRNFGFKGYDQVDYLGVNGKMSEPCAAMGLTSFEAIDEIIAINRRNYECYRDALANVAGVQVIEYNSSERNNFQYVVLDFDAAVARVSRDELVQSLHAENVIARKYFSPGCHRMEPYATLQPNAGNLLPETERIASRVVVLPTGQTVDEPTVHSVCGIIRECLQKRAGRQALNAGKQTEASPDMARP